jgi:putative beta-lysine N-acetyltransferase
MRENIVYFGVWQGETLVALSSAEMDLAAGSAEMTDFATLPEHRGQGLATGLLTVMEQEMEKRGLHTLFTIARAVSFGMNITFARRGFRYGGTLTRNTQISGCLECMNIWHKPLRTEH